MTKIKSLANKNISFFVTSFSNIEIVLDSRILDVSIQAQLDKKKEFKKKQDSQEKKKTKTTDEVSTTKVINFVDTMFFQSLRLATSDIHIEQFKNNVARIRFRIDGIMKVQEGLGKQLAENYNACLIDKNFVKPLDNKRIKELAKKYQLLITFEENSIKGGAGSAVAEFLADNNLKVSLLNFGISDEFVEHGSPEHQKVSSGLGKEEITEKINSRLIQL